MAKVGRNQPCPCGSGIKTKRCCGVARGPSPHQLATVFLNLQARQWAPLLADHTPEQLDELFHEVAELAHTDLSLHATLPRLLPPALERLRTAIANRDPEAACTAMPAALDVIDTPVERERLARAVLALHDDGHHIDCATTAYAIIDLADHNTNSALLFGALFQALAINSGISTTPSGLQVAAR